MDPAPDGGCDAIAVRGAWKTFGKGDKGTPVLTNLTLTVKEGTIYTLLGSSGCGKTTLLSCIVGMTKLERGDIKILGIRPGTKGSGVPGKKVGYMPQEIAIYGEFTIKEAMQYFGRINGMSTVQVVDRMMFLIKFLHLPPCHRIIRSLSGGQQRRVSFAVALLHEPKILILDEPTVGVDPLLRKSIWKHLSGLVVEKKTSVIITTHYIEEANEAHCIGLMRNGRLLAEDSPQSLLDKHNCVKLEDVFFKLCELDTTDDEFGSVRAIDGAARNSKVSQDDAENIASNMDDPTGNSLEMETCKERSTVALCNEINRDGGNNNAAVSPTSPAFNRSVEQLIEEGEADNSEGQTDKSRKQSESDKSQKRSRTTTSAVAATEENQRNGCVEYFENSCAFDPIGVWHRMNALLKKNFLCMWRNIGFVLFMFFLPAVQAVLFCVAIGGNPTLLPLGVINNEVPDPANCIVSPGCSISNMSCNFIKQIPAETISLTSFMNESDALDEVKQGNIWGYLMIPNNFTDIMVDRGLNNDHGKPISSSLSSSSSMNEQNGFQGTHIELKLDMTSQQISFNIQRSIALAFQKYTTTLLFDCGMNETSEVPPETFAQPIYGATDSSFREFMAPGIILSIIFFMSVALTGSAFITERKEGMLNRTLVSGVTKVEVLSAHMLTQYFVMVGQTMLVLAVMIWVFHIAIEGSVMLVILLTVFQGTCGMAFGFLISCVCSEERNAIQMALGSFYPNLLLSGVVWPLESIPFYIRRVAFFLPQTMACEAMRSIFSRGWSIEHPKVWPGFAASIVWSGVFWLIALSLVKFRKK